MTAYPVPAPSVAEGAATSRATANAAMERYAAGDDSAFSELYDVLAPKLYRYLLRQTRDVVAAEDLLQQTMLKIHCTRGRFFAGAAVIPWAYAIARRLFIDSHRQRKRESARNEAHSLEEPVVPDGVEDLLEAKRLALEVEREVARLPEAQRVVFELMKKDDLSIREIAEVLGTTANAVKLRAHRAHVALRMAMSDKAEFEGG
jgi:RNA polymerase sigma-70 factor, ECF subfamily